MEFLTFAYVLMYGRGDLDEEPIQPTEAPGNLAAVARSTGPTMAVLWDHAKQTWRSNPAVVAAMYANPERFRTRLVDRATADHEALRFASKPLPSEAGLTVICRPALA